MANVARAEIPKLVCEHIIITSRYFIKRNQGLVLRELTDEENWLFDDGMLFATEKSNQIFEQSYRISIYEDNTSSELPVFYVRDLEEAPHDIGTI